MKIRKCIVLMILMVICAGCGPQQQAGETVSRGETVSGTAVEKPAIREMKTIKENGHYMVSEYDPDGNLLTEIYYDADSNETGRTDYTYIENGNMSLKVSTGSGRGSYQKIVYDADGNKTEEYDGDSEADAVLNNKYEYSDGKLIREIFYAHQEAPFWIQEYEYDENGLLIRKEQKSEDGYIYRSWDYTYDDAGKMTHMTEEYYEYRIEYSYDAEERPVLEEEYFNGELGYTQKYEYGEYGITDQYYISSDTDGWHKRTHYDANGRKISEANVLDNGREVVQITMEYDDAGNLIHSKDTRGYEYTAEYNEYGYPIRVHDVCTDTMRNAGTYDISEKYEYVYYESTTG